MALLSNYLNQKIISLRLIEHHRHAIVNPDAGGAGRETRREIMSVHTVVSDYLRRRVALWERRRTERFVRNLPLEIQKDIGWSDSDARRRRLKERESLWERRW